MINLLTNAAKYAKGQPVDVRISADETTDDRMEIVDRLRTSPAYSEIEVQDHGPGISREAQERILRRFERAVEGQSIAGPGLGLRSVHFRRGRR
jgi:signal transduction histidine kinase